MRVTFVLPLITISGGVKSTFEIANRMHLKGHEVSVVYPLIPSLVAKHPFDLKTRADKARGFLDNVKRGNRIDWFDLHCDLIRATTLAEANIPRGDAILATWWANAYDVDGYGRDRGKKFYIIRSYETWGGPEDAVNRSYTLPLHKVAVSTWLKDLIEKKFDGPVYGPILNGVDLNLFFMEREDFEAHDPISIGLLYRSHSLKGMQDALSAFLSVERECPGLKFVLFGEIPIPEDMRIIEKLQNVEMHEMPYGDRLREIYNYLDIFVFPSRFEGFANPPMEAMACGVACVTTKVGAVLDYTDPGETALCVEPGQPQEIVDAILTLLEDDEKRRDIARAGHENIKRFSWEDTVDELERTIIDVLSSPGD